MTTMSQPINPREAAREWLAHTITKNWHPELGGHDRIQRLAADMEAEAFRNNWPIETAIALAVEWCEIQNESGLSHASHT